MLALHDYRAQLHRCGGLLSETTDPASENAYAVDDPTRCHRCTALAIKQDAYTKSPHPEALVWTARRR